MTEPDEHDISYDEAVAIGIDASERLFEMGACEGTMISGSITKGFYDGYSDVDLGFFYSGEVPSEEAYLEALDRMGAENTLDGDPISIVLTDYWGNFRYRGIDFDVRFHEVKETRDRLRSLREGDVPLPQPNLVIHPFGRYQSFLAFTIRNCRVVCEEDGVVTRLKEYLEPYPKDLRDFHLWYRIKAANHMLDRIRVAARREDLFYVHACSARIIRMMCVAVFALNDEYYPTGKWNEGFIERFERVPDEFVTLVADVVDNPLAERTDFLEVVDTLEALIERIHELAREHFKDPLRGEY